MDEKDFRDLSYTLRNEISEKICFMNDVNCSNRIVKAHSIQNNKILKNISDNGFVLYFDFKFDSQENLSFDLKPRGRKVATTFYGFCSYHDQMIFRPIELEDYYPGNKEQEFLFAYRCLAKEYLAKKECSNINESLFKKFFPEINDSKISEIMNKHTEAYNLGSTIALKKLEKDRAAFNMNLKKRRFNKIESFVRVLPENYQISVSSTFYPETDLNGNVINNIKTLGNGLTQLYFTIIPQNNETFIIFSFLTSQKNAFIQLKKQILDLNEDELKRVVTNIICKHTENFVVSPKKWELIPDEVKDIFLISFKENSFIDKIDLSKIDDINIFV